MTWITKHWEASEVVDAPSFANFVQQEIGTPYPTGKQMATLRHKTAEYFEQNPRANWQTLVKITYWSRLNRRHPAHAWHIILDARYAWRDGYLPELNPSQHRSDDITARIEEALSVETDDDWRSVLLGAGAASREEVLAKWTTHRSAVSP